MTGGPVIGLEIHVQLTEAGTKLFCGCSSDYRGMPPNTNVCPVCLGLPGALPVPQPGPVAAAVAASLALGCKMPRSIVFTRKHYFYPDLPKNYQITEYEGAHGAPVCLGAVFRYLDAEGWEWRSVHIRRINLEEDPGRSSYDKGGITGSRAVRVDYNRSGVALLEVVTEPDLRGPRDARSMVEYLLLVLKYLGVTDPSKEGAFRVDANISIPPGERVEIKNIGSTLELERALRYEILRQTKILEHGGTVRRETRHWDASRGVTRSLRGKEVEEEYLYFPDPDLPPLPIAGSLLERARRLTALLPCDVLRTLERDGIRREIAWSIAQSPALAKLYLEAKRAVSDRRLLAQVLGVVVKGVLNDMGVEPERVPLPPARSIAYLVNQAAEGRVPYDTLKGIVIPRLLRNPSAEPVSLVPEAAEVSVELVRRVLREEEKAVRDYLSGREKALNYLVGMVIRRLGKKAVDPRRVRELILAVLEDEFKDHEEHSYSDSSNDSG